MTQPASKRLVTEAAQTAALTAKQNHSAQLDAVAALTTTAYGRALLELIDSNGLTGLLSAASTSAPGAVQLASTMEATTGTSTTRAVTPAGLKAAVDALVASAPGALDTLGEIATQLASDETGAAALTALVTNVRNGSDSTFAASLDAATDKRVGKALSPINFGVVPNNGGDPVQNRTNFQAFLAYVIANNVGAAHIGGDWTLAAPGDGSPVLTIGSDPLTKRFIGNCNITVTGTAPAILKCTNMTRTQWDTLRLTGPGSTGTYSSRTIQTGLWLDNSGRNKWARIDATFMAYGAIYAGLNNTSLNDYGFVKPTDCGSGAKFGTTHYGATTTWGFVSNNGGWTSVSSDSTISVATMPPTFLTGSDNTTYGLPGDNPFLIRLPLVGGGTRLHYIKSFDTVAGTINVSPQIDDPATYSIYDPAGTAAYVYGGGLILRGSDSNVSEFSGVDAIRCGIAVAAASLYHPIGRRITTQVCGVGITLGRTPSGAGLGGRFDGAYFENNIDDIVLINRPTSGSVYTTITGTYALNLAKCSVVGARRNPNGTNALNTGDSQFGRVVLDWQGRRVAPEKDNYNGPYGTSTYNIDIVRADQTVPIYRDTVTVNATLDEDLHRITGHDSLEVVVVGTGANSAPTGAVGFGVPAGFTIAGRKATDAVTNGTTTVTSATAAFTSTDVGRPVRLDGAGPVVGDLPTDLVTTIATFVSATEVTLATTPTLVGSAVTMRFGGLYSAFTIAPRFLLRFDYVTKNVTITELSRRAITPLVFSKAGVLTVGAGSHRVYIDRDSTLLSARANVGVAPVSTDLIVDVNKNGTTLFTTQSTRPTVPVGANTSGRVTPQVTSLLDGDYLTVDVDQAGGTAADLTVQIRVV